MAEYRLPLVAKGMIDEVWRIAQEARKELKEARRSQQAAHDLFQDQYHTLETLGSFNAAQGYHIAKGMQDALITRRQGKWDVETLEELVAFFDNIQPKLLNAKMRIDRQEQSARAYIRHEGLAEQIQDAG